MATRTPTDRFDDLPDGLDRVGSHRAPERRGRSWIALAWAALATGLLVGAGVVGLSLFTDSIRNIELPFSSSTGTAATPDAAPSEDAAPSVTPAIDSALPITVLNGTATEGLANDVGNLLESEGWNGAALGVGSRSSAATTDVATTVVFFLDAASEGAALALVDSLGVGEIRLSQEYPSSPVTVLLGADYALPAG